MSVTCVLCNGPHAELVGQLPVEALVARWRKEYDIDVSGNFVSDSLSRHVCSTCHLEFFLPLVAGDERFYDRIQDFDWYYERDKWEFDEARQLLKKSDHVVDFGCGDGNFLDYLRSNGFANVYGLDKNPKAVEKAKARGLVAATEIGELGIERVDAVCSFQVLEHVTQVRGFLQDMCSVASPGAKVVIAVPNQASFIGNDANTPNFPPHHLTRWSKPSLQAIQGLLPLRLGQIVEEPLSTRHVDWFVAYAVSRVADRGSSRAKRVLAWRVLRPALKAALASRTLRSKVPGHTIMAVYQKN